MYSGLQVSDIKVIIIIVIPGIPDFPRLVISVNSSLANLARLGPPTARVSSNWKQLC